MLHVARLTDSRQQCAVVASLSATKAARFASQSSSILSRVFTVLFPAESPAINALLATLYISGPPNLLLALCPPDIDPASLSVMVAFAVGGLLGDTLFHLLPEIFLGEDEVTKARFVLVEPKRNLLLGVAILVGFMTFVAMDKSLRIATGGAGHTHDHGHGHAEGKGAAATEAISTAVEKVEGKAKSRKGNKATNGEVAPSKEEKEISASVKMGGYLNLMSASPCSPGWRR